MAIWQWALLFFAAIGAVGTFAALGERMVKAQQDTNALLARIESELAQLRAERNG